VSTPSARNKELDKGKQRKGSCEHKSSSRCNKEFGIFMYYIYFEWRNHPSLCTLANGGVPEVNGAVALEGKL